jgi:NADPH:quinone reductase-like Zn-dependent oxidoreductase
VKAVTIRNYGGPEQLRYEEVLAPQAGPGQVLVRVHAASINPVDYKVASGAFRALGSLTFPWIPGSDLSGVIVGVGPGATGFADGTPVFGHCPSGAYAELAVAPAATVARKPEAVTHVEAASIPIAAQTAWQALFDHGQLQAGQSVLIHAAAGGVGSFAVQLARWKGATVIGTASADNADYVRSLGADRVIDYRTTPFDTAVKDVDLVLDAVGGEVQRRSSAVLRRGGRLVSIVGPPPEDEAQKHGVDAVLFRMQPSTALLEQLAKLMVEGVIRSVVSKTYPLSQAREAWQEHMKGHNRGKVVLEVAS